MARALLESEGFDVVGEAADGASAIEAANELRPDVILLDVHLPDIDGFEVAAALASNGKACAVVADVESRRARLRQAGGTERRPRLHRQGRPLGRGTFGLTRMTRTAWLGFVTSPALAAGAGAFAITLTSDHQDVPRLTAVLVLLTGWSFILAGLIARTRRPHNRTGLLIAVGFGWFVGAPMSANDSLFWTIESHSTQSPAGFSFTSCLPIQRAASGRGRSVRSSPSGTC